MEDGRILSETMGVTALSEALSGSHEDIEAMLIKAGAGIDLAKRSE